MLRRANPPWSSAGGCRESWGPYIYTRTSLGTLGVGFSFISICLLRNKTDDSSAIKFSLLRTQEWLPGPHSFSQVPVSQNRDIRVGKITQASHTRTWATEPQMQTESCGSKSGLLSLDGVVHHPRAQLLAAVSLPCTLAHTAVPQPSVVEMLSVQDADNKPRSSVGN